jgi:hypothetical protein
MRALIRRLAAFCVRLGRHRAEVYLTELDARTIKDIGLEPWRSPLGAEVERRRQLSRRPYARAY